MFIPDLLAGKRILITGGGTGLGRAMADRFLQLGATVYICGRRSGVLETTAFELEPISPGHVHQRTCDVRDTVAVESLLDAIWTDGPLDILVNNAAGNFLAKTEELSLRAFEAVIGIVLNGSLNTTLGCGRRWLAAKRTATVLNIVTTYAASGSGSAYVVPSAIAKAGVMALTTSLAVEWGPRGIRLNGIAPGPIPTEGAFSRLMPSLDLEKLALRRVPLHRFGTPAELANLAAFLISDGCTYINGDVVVMDGGEWLQGAGEFSYAGQVLADADWEAMKPKKK
jgi:NAD(P)-dependent dehydrogenase (short-subunit alcohol dehydrogenase family)